MKITSLNLIPYEIPWNDKTRKGYWLEIVVDHQHRGYGEIAPLPEWSRETLKEAFDQLQQRKETLYSMEWNDFLDPSFFQQLADLTLLPSVLFGLESALLSILSPISCSRVSLSALLLGSPEQILEQARLRFNEGVTHAKLKIGHLTFSQAEQLIWALKDQFYLRIDVNRTWNTEESLAFFSQFPLDSFDYVEEPLQNPLDLIHFKHPLAIDESFPSPLSIEFLEKLPNLKALIYKPMIQGGLLNCMPLHEWTKKRGVELILSSSFESDLGLSSIVEMAHRLALTAPVGIGTYHYMSRALMPVLYDLKVGKDAICTRRS